MAFVAAARAAGALNARLVACPGAASLRLPQAHSGVPSSSSSSSSTHSSSNGAASAGSRRGVAAAAAAAAAAPGGERYPLSGGGLIEVREYTLAPAGIKPYLKLTAEHAALRSRLLPFLGMFTCDVGGELNKVTHLYAYASMDEREEARRAAARDKAWSAYVDKGREYMVKQESRILVEATGIYEATGSPGAAAFQAPAAAAGAGPGMYELRQYQLHPGYGSVPKLLKAFQEGLPDKIAADKEGRLVAFAHSDIGMLNQVLELWRYPSAAACIRARQASRQVPKWRATIAEVTPGVQHFTTSFMVPCSFSPWQ